MADQTEWGPWINHAGHGFPVAIGTLVERLFDHPIDCLNGERINPISTFQGPLTVDELPAWLWALPRQHRAGTIPRVIRYRIGKPRGLAILIDALADLPELIDS